MDILLASRSSAVSSGLLYLMLRLLVAVDWLRGSGVQPLAHSYEPLDLIPVTASRTTCWSQIGDIQRSNATTDY